MDRARLHEWWLSSQAVLVGATSSYIALFVGLWVWGVVASHVSLPLLHWLSLQGFVAKGDSLIGLIYDLISVIAVTLVGLAFGVVTALLAGPRRIVAAVALVVTIAAFLVNRVDSDWRFNAFEHWFVWVLALAVALGLLLVHRKETKHAV